MESITDASERCLLRKIMNNRDYWNVYRFSCLHYNTDKMNKLETGLFKSVWPFSEHQALNSSSYFITDFVEGNDFHKHDFEYIFCLTVWIDGYFRLTFATTTRTTKILQPFFDALFFSTKVFLVFTQVWRFNFCVRKTWSDLS